MIEKKDLVKIKDYLYEIPQSFRSDMRVPARIYTNEKLLAKTLEDRSLEQAINVATLPGIVKYSLAMPDIHQGYGFPIGGVAATKIPGGVISPGGVGYDINCGMRLLTSQISETELRPYLVKLVDRLYEKVPSGLGRGGKIITRGREIDQVLKEGASWAVKAGYGSEEDLEYLEARGQLAEADPSWVSDKAKKRGADQLGTLGSGNHFLEVQKVAEVFNDEVAQTFGLFKNQITITVHSGSRGLGYQVCADYLRILQQKIAKAGIKLPDRELIYTDSQSAEGQNYFKAMSSAANYAWANRQCLAHLVRKVWEEVLKNHKIPPRLKFVYDVAHNIAKREEYSIDNKKISLLVHRKGATRAFGPGHPEIPKDYQSVGQPILIPGSMGTASYVLAGTQKAMETTFGSVCHGAGRVLSRTAAKKQMSVSTLKSELERKGVIIRCRSPKGLLEEAPQAYKNIHEVVEVVCQAGLAQKVVKLQPLGVIKGD